MFSFIEPARIYFKKPVWFFISTTILWVYPNSSPICVVLGSNMSALHMVKQHMTSGLALDFQLLFSCLLILVRIFSTYGCLCKYICESKLCRKISFSIYVIFCLYSPHWTNVLFSGKLCMIQCCFFHMYLEDFYWKDIYAGILIYGTICKTWSHCFVPYNISFDIVYLFFYYLFEKKVYVFYFWLVFILCIFTVYQNLCTLLKVFTMMCVYVYFDYCVWIL